MKPQKRLEARRLRAQEGLPYKAIARALDVSPSSVHKWTRDIPITEEHRKRNLAHLTPESEIVKKRARTWVETNRARRRAFQPAGRERAKRSDPLHEAGCMLYWAEGSKDRNCLNFANSDVEMMRFFKRFLDDCFSLTPDDCTARLNVYLGNGMSIEQIEDWGLSVLSLPRSCLRAHQINHFPTSSSGRKRDCLPYGVCSLRIRKSTWLIQHIYGAIQEYGGFDEPAWLDCERRKYDDPKPADGSLAA